MPRRNSAHPTLLTVAAVLVLTMAGCGSSSSKKKLSSADVAKRADAACTAAGTKVKRLDAPTSLSTLATYSRSVRTIGADLEQTLQKLDGPAGSAAKLDAYRTGLHKATALVGELGAAAQRGDANSVRRLADRVASTDIGVLAARAGLSSCATAVILPAR